MVGPDEASTEAVGHAAARKLLQLLELVRSTPVGAAVYRQAETLLEQLQQDCLRTERSYAGLCTSLLDRQLEAISVDDPRYPELQVLRQQIQLPLLAADADTLLNRLEQLLNDRPPAMPPVDRPGRSAPAGREVPAEQSPAEIGQVQESLGREIRETLAQNQEFGVMLDLVLSELERVRDRGEAEQVKEQLLGQVKRLHAGHFALAKKLDSADRYLNMLALGSRHLNQELSRARELSLTDELTGLPNRRAFLQRLEEEVARVERYGTPLAMAMIDLDGFKDVNDRHGHAVGDEILRCYAHRIFAIFRQHDLIARYGGEEFAVLLPNTDRDGAMSALRKAKNRAVSIHCEEIPAAVAVPSFSAGIAACRRGENAADLIQRADEALYRAKDLGRDRVELDSMPMP